MKKRLIILLVISLLFITACTNKEEIKKEATNKVNTTIADITNISEETIKESYLYIIENYQNHKDKEVYEKLQYHIKYLQSLGTYSKDNELTILSNNISTYIEKSNKTNKQKVTKSINKISGNEETIIKEIYNNYLKLKVVKTIIEEQTPIAQGDVNDKNMTTITNITKAFEYINKHSQNPFKNDEVLEKTIYYSIYLSKLGSSENDITKLGQSMIKYLSTLDESEKDEVIKLLSSITKNQDSKIQNYYNEIVRNA